MVPVVIYRSPSTAVSATVQDFHDEGNRYVPRDGGVEGLLEFLRQRGGPEVGLHWSLVAGCWLLVVDAFVAGCCLLLAVCCVCCVLLLLLACASTAGLHTH